MFNNISSTVNNDGGKVVAIYLLNRKYTTMDVTLLLNGVMANMVLSNVQKQSYQRDATSLPS